MNKKLKQLILAASCMAIAEVVPVAAETVYAAEVSNSVVQQTETLNAAIVRINEGHESVSDYKLLGIKM